MFIDNIPCVSVLFLHERQTLSEQTDACSRRLIVNIPIYCLREGVAYLSIDKEPRSVSDGSLSTCERVFTGLEYSV